MTPDPQLSDLGEPWAEMVDRIADWQVDLLRRKHSEMAAGLDLAARCDIEGATDWRDLQNTGDRYADR